MGREQDSHEGDTHRFLGAAKNEHKNLVPFAKLGLRGLLNLIDDRTATALLSSSGRAPESVNLTYSGGQLVSVTGATTNLSLSYNGDGTLDVVVDARDGVNYKMGYTGSDLTSVTVS